MSMMNLMLLVADSTNVVGDHNTFGENAGIAMIVLAALLGISLLMNGWPKIRVHHHNWPEKKNDDYVEDERQ